MRELDVPGDEFDWDDQDAEKDEMDPGKTGQAEDLYKAASTSSVNLRWSMARS